MDCCYLLVSQWMLRTLASLVNCTLRSTFGGLFFFYSLDVIRQHLADDCL